MEVNTRPLLQASESDSDIEERTPRYEVERSTTGHDDIINDSVIMYRDETRFKNEPADRYYVAYIIFYILGLATLIPWNFFITADEYWMYKFRDIHNHTSIHQKTPLQIMFTSYLSVATSVPTTFFLILNAALSRKVPLGIRMIGSLSIMLILFIVTTVFVKINTDLWQEQFFAITMVVVVFLSIFSAIMSGGLYGIVGKFSPTYITAVVSGQSLGGVFAAIAEILSLTFGVTATFSAFVYFMIANVTLALSIIAYIILSNSVFFKYHTIDKAKALAELEATTSLTFYGTISYTVILKKIRVYAFSIVWVFLVTLSVFPSVTALIESEHEGNGSLWNDVYFVPVVTYLVFSLGDYFGRIIAGILQWPNQKQGWILITLNFMRVGFIPLLMLCNANPRHNMPILISKDVYYIIIMACFSLSSGYLTNISMINAPKSVEPHEKEVASSMMAAFLGIGLAFGSALSLITVEML
ncbi:equilibrative nucleoside transporter 1 [Chrysoperla carnea]|uniref:equilibrative nucleoside transporter 1 n=1 Tax=Chrysoperla carnea TaxID=189513 RepID=UPI001D0797A6|nr:equilibrative nucleoside transporter 1 [Chrysoperla carnea]